MNNFIDLSFNSNQYRIDNVACDTKRTKADGPQNVWHKNAFSLIRLIE